VPSSWASERIVNAAIPFSSAITIALRKYPRSAQWGTFICALVSVLSYLCSRSLLSSYLPRTLAFLYFVR
jgi:hypothetical protein